MTTKLRPEAYIEFWKTAFEQEIGLRIEVEPKDQMIFINQLYDARKVCGGYDKMIIFQPAPEGTVFIAHMDAELPE